MGKKGTLLLAFCLNITYICFGQAPEGRIKRVEELQKIYLTRQLSLTSEESNRFFPIYHQYRNEIKRTRRERNNDEIEFAEHMIAVRKKYKSEFRVVLSSDERVNRIFLAEKNFQKILIEEVGKRKLRDKQRLWGAF